MKEKLHLGNNYDRVHILETVFHCQITVAGLTIIHLAAPNITKIYRKQFLNYYNNQNI